MCVKFKSKKVQNVMIHVLGSNVKAGIEKY